MKNAMWKLKADWADYANRLSLFESRGAFNVDAIKPIDYLYRPDGVRWQNTQVKK